MHPLRNIKEGKNHDERMSNINSPSLFLNNDIPQIPFHKNQSKFLSRVRSTRFALAMEYKWNLLANKFSFLFNNYKDYFVVGFLLFLSFLFVTVTIVITKHKDNIRKQIISQERLIVNDVDLKLGVDHDEETKEYKKIVASLLKGYKESSFEDLKKIQSNNYQVKEYSDVIRSRDNLNSILNRVNFSDKQLEQLYEAIGKAIPRDKIKITPGYALKMVYLKKRMVYEMLNNNSIQKNLFSFPPYYKISWENHLYFMSIRLNPEDILEIYRNQQGQFIAKFKRYPLTKRYKKIDITIQNSLYEDAIRNGASSGMIMEALNHLGFNVDFQRDILDGDKMVMVVEEYADFENKKVRGGDLMYVRLKLRKVKEDVSMYRYEYGGRVGFFDKNGFANQKQIMRTPVEGARISSGFGWRRHPVLGYSKLHKGMDFAAPTGTPIFAAGDGVIEKAGWFSSYGQYVRIKHNNKYSTAYAHMSLIKSSMKPGVRVKQRQVIGYVGTTGRSTGPHLHFELLVGNVQINPKNVKFASIEKLGSKDMSGFKQLVATISKLL